MMSRKILLGFMVLILTFSLAAYSSAQTSTIPIWIKNVAGFWANDEISDREFLSAIQYLLDHEMLSDSSSPSKSKDVSIDEESSDVEIKDESFSDLDLLTYKVVQLQELTSNSKIIQAVIDSNEEFAAMDDPQQYILDKDIQWREQPKNKNSPFMNLLIENNISNILKTKSITSHAEFGEVVFPEIIVTNAFGANIAISQRTDDYNQSDEIWWQKAKYRTAQFLDPEWDESARIFSSDIVLMIVDENEHFIGVLNAATPVR